MHRGVGRAGALWVVAAVLLVLLVGLLVTSSTGTPTGTSTSTARPSTSASSATASTSSQASRLTASTVSSASASTTTSGAATTSAGADLTRFVNPFIGTGDSPSPCWAACGGDVFPGAAYPMGMVQWSPDTVSNPAGGYFYNDTVIKDMSLTHFSGRGCSVYQDIPFMPYVGSIVGAPSATASVYYSSFSHADEIARPGYYQVHLDGPNVTAELSVTPHTGVGRFVYPPSKASTMIIDAGGSVNGNSASAVTIAPAQDEVTGYAQSTVGCGSNPYVVYFAAKFDRPFSSYGTWDGGAVSRGSNSSSGQYTGAFLIFDTSSNPALDVQVGISFVSVANAQLNLSAESVNFDIGAAASAASAAWNARLGSIQVQGGTYNETVDFYTAMYHIFFHPNIFSDVNGQYLGFDGKVHTVAAGHVQYENIAGWDSYRTQIRLLSILEPSVVSDVAQSLVNDAEQNGGSLPRWEQANADSHGMSGDDGDVMIAEAYGFGATNFDAAAALQAMVVGQSQEREGFSQYVQLGYVPADLNPGLSTASVTLEYANDDFAIAQFANALGNVSAYSTYLARSGSWQKVFDQSSGYVEQRNSDGSWVQGFDPTSEDGFQEGDSAQYTWMVTYDLSGLFSMMGGSPAAVARLDNFFSQLNAGPTSPYAWMGNEPSIEVPWEYDFAQAPSHTQNVVREIETQLWTDSPQGMPGNDDSGEMSSWYIFAAIGIYPEITGVPGFVIGSPLFTSVTLHLQGGQPIQISAPAASDSRPYVQGLEVDGSPTSSLWLPWASVEGGATLNFSLGASQSTWGSATGDTPPSYPPVPFPVSPVPVSLVAVEAKASA